ncbi:MAG: hypothetical protein AAF564_06250 [Bacteroidota bacterium]
MHFTVSDLLGASSAFALFPLVIILPGFALGYFSDILQFRSRGLGYQLSVALLLSLACCPIAIYLIGKTSGIAAVWTLLAVSWMGFFTTSFVGRSFAMDRLRAMVKQHLRLLLGLGIALLVAMGYMVDLVLDGELVRPLVSYDYTKHTAVTNAISMTGIPPVNPSFYPTAPVELFYYYFWFQLCSIVDIVGGSIVTARHAVMGSIMWGGISLVVVMLFWMKRQRIKLGLSPRHIVRGLLLLLVTGLDFIPAYSGYLTHSTQGADGLLIPSIEWWNEQVSAWISAILWVPHYVGAFVCCLFAFLLINERFNEETGAGSNLLLLFAVLALASAVGMSIWIAFAAAVILMVWMIVVLTIDRKNELFPLLLVGLTTALLLVPYILDLYGSQSLSRSPLAFTVRPFPILEQMRLGVSGVGMLLLRLLALPINYILELGFFLMATWLFWDFRKKEARPLEREEQFMLVMFLVSLLLCTFVKSNIKNNDLGWRGFMFAQFAMLVYGIPVCAACFGSKAYPTLKLEPAMRYVLIGMLALGIGSNVYEAFVIRQFSYAEQGAYGYAIRETYEWIDQTAPQEAVLQHNPKIEIEYFHALYGNRQVAIADTTLGQLYGVNRDTFYTHYDAIARIFEDQNTPAEVQAMTNLYNIDLLVVKKADPVWGNSASWVWQSEPIFQNAYCKVFSTRQLVSRRTSP